MATIANLADAAERALWALEDALDDLAAQHKTPTAHYDVHRLRQLRDRIDNDTARKLDRAGINRRERS